MPDQPAAGFAALRPAIKKRWETLLRAVPAAHPGTTSLISPEMMVFMLDDSLGRLDAHLEKPGKDDRRKGELLPYGPMRASCQCGLHLLLTYYLLGARALRETLPTDFSHRVEVLHDFNRMSHDEVAALCAICRQRGGPTCGLRPGAELSLPAAASPATPSATGPSRGETPG